MYFSKFIMSKDYPYMKTLGYSCPLGQHLANRELSRCGYWYLLGFPCCCLQLLPLLFPIVISAVYFCPNFNYMNQWLKTGHCIIKLFLRSIFGVPISCKLHFKIIFCSGDMAVRRTEQVLYTQALLFNDGRRQSVTNK